MLKLLLCKVGRHDDDWIYVPGPRQYDRLSDQWRATVSCNQTSKCKRCGSKGSRVRHDVEAWFDDGVLTAFEAGLCVAALEEALNQGRPEIFNTDQGAQFTSETFTQMLQEQGIQVSMDGKGRYLDNIFVERLWRSIKYEEVYLKAYQTVAEARTGIEAYLEFYNRQRPHQALGYRTPAEVYQNGQEEGSSSTRSRTAIGLGET